MFMMVMMMMSVTCSGLFRPVVNWEKKYIVNKNDVREELDPLNGREDSQSKKSETQPQSYINCMYKALRGNHILHEF